MATGYQRVFLSYTSELRDHPCEYPFVSAARSAVARANLAVAEMNYVAARDQDPASYCSELVGFSDVYVGIIGFRYGSPLRSHPVRSFTELEFEVATTRGIRRLLFLLDDRVALPLPVKYLVDMRYSRRQAAFRRRLQELSGLTIAFVGTPQELELKLYQGLVELGALCCGVVAPCLQRRRENGVAAPRRSR